MVQTREAAAPAAAVPPRTRRGRRRRRSQAGLAFVAPFGALFVLVLVVPILYAAYLSLFQERLLGGNTFVGLANYGKLFADPQFWDGVARVALFTLVQVPIMLTIATALALALDSRRLHGA